MKDMEIELKLRCMNKEAFDEVLLSPLLAAGQAERGSCLMEAYYYDTPDFQLQKQRLAYRVRREGENWIAAVKGGGSVENGLHTRQEWNVPVTGCEPDLSVFEKLEIWPQLAAAAARQELQPVLVTRFLRQHLLMTCADGSLVEVAADCGEIIAGQRQEPILEVELELKCGQAQALQQLGEALCAAYPLIPENDSKYYRGLKLAGLVQR